MLNFQNHFSDHLSSASKKLYHSLYCIQCFFKDLKPFTAVAKKFAADGWSLAELLELTRRFPTERTSEAEKFPTFLLRRLRSGERPPEAKEEDWAVTQELSTMFLSPLRLVSCRGPPLGSVAS